MAASPSRSSSNDDAATIESRIAELKAFDVVRYAQKANSNLAVLRLMHRRGVVVDAVTAGEVHRALEAGFKGDTDPPGIVFTADIFDDDALDVIASHRPVNLIDSDIKPFFI